MSKQRTGWQMQILRSRQRKTVYMFARNILGNVICTYISRILARGLAGQLASQAVSQLPCFILKYLSQLGRQLGRSNRLNDFLIITVLALFSGIQKSLTFHSFYGNTKGSYLATNLSNLLLLLLLLLLQLLLLLLLILLRKSFLLSICTKQVDNTTEIKIR